MTDIDAAIPPDQPRRRLPKRLTGISGFDEVTDGGLPAGRASVVAGPPGSGKSLFAMQFLVNGATRFAEPGVFVSFEESRADLVANVASLGLDIEGLERDERLLIDAVSLDPGVIVETGEFNLDALLLRLAWAVEKVGAKRVTIDSLEALFDAFSDPSLIRAELRRLFRWLKEQGLTTVVTSERTESSPAQTGMQEFLADCVVLLDHRVVDEVSTRRLRVSKYRGSVHRANEYPFLIGDNGLEVLPITSLGLTQQVSTERCSTGVPGLDEMLGGDGVFRASSVLISGSSGTGKTTVAASFADAACQRGERVLYFGFEESEAEIRRNMASVGLELSGWIDQGLLHFHCERPTTFGLEEHLVNMQRKIREIAPTLVVIDPVSSLARSSTPLDVSAMFMRQIYYLKAGGITSVMTALTEADVTEHTEQNISSLVDSWILLVNIEGNNERNRGIFILKSRGMAHSNQIREFVLGAGGVQVLPVVVGPRGVLTGSARLRETSVDRDVALGLEQKSGELNRALEARRATVDAQIAALRADLDSEERLTRKLIAASAEREREVLRDRARQGLERSTRPKVHE